MRFSIILPSLLADFPGAATGRDRKLIRAIDSVMNQSFYDFELIIIADGCTLTRHLVSTRFSDERLKLLYVERKNLWSNNARNAGIEAAKGKYITYLDNDDWIGPDHLKIINEQLTDEDWIYSNDWIRDIKSSQWFERPCDVSQYGRCGTSNICHKSSLALRWNETGYGHDFAFIQQLNQFQNNKHIATAQYYVCHVGKLYCI